MQFPSKWWVHTVLVDPQAVTTHDYKHVFTEYTYVNALQLDLSVVGALFGESFFTARPVYCSRKLSSIICIK